MAFKGNKYLLIKIILYRIYLASTQLKPSWSRYCFPGYDEPQYKAIFEVKITHDKSYHAISSMKMVNQLNL